MLQVGLYPFSLLCAYTLYFYLQQLFDWHPLPAAYAAVMLAGIPLLVAEWRCPLRLDWRPSWLQIRRDVAELIVVQSLLPMALLSSAALFWNWLGFKEGVLFAAWPQHLPLLAQFILLLVLAEAAQYAWHRACHTWPLLWPLHEAHHRPTLLYSLNTGRFHPADKLVEFVSNIAIWVWLGCPWPVVGAYYVFFAITGFFQHCNFAARLGVFNWLIASAETHRYHHDRQNRGGSVNLANNLVLFDLIFGTFFWHRQEPAKTPRQVGMLGGERETSWREDWWTTPRKRWQPQLDRLLNFLSRQLFQIVLPLKQKYGLQPELKKFQQACTQPRATQENLLLTLLQEQAQTAFGKQHNFAQIRSWAEWKQAVPIQDYEGFRPWINQILEGGQAILTQEKPVYFTKTSGTTGLPKYLPMTRTSQQRLVWANSMVIHSHWRQDPDSMNGLLFIVTGGEVEESIGDGFPAGSLSGRIYASSPALLRRKLVVPAQVNALNDAREKYRALAVLALLSPDTTLYGSPNPSTLLKIQETLLNEREALSQRLRERRYTQRFEHQIGHALALLHDPSPLTLQKVWPQLRTVSLWKQGSCQYLLPQVRKAIGPKVALVEMGYISSEFRGTINLGLQEDLEVPLINDVFFEFIARSDYESGVRDTILIDQLQPGVDYFVIVTTRGGLYRYAMNDYIRVGTQRFAHTPSFSFLEKGKGVTNLTGEKLSESQLVHFFSAPSQAHLETRFFLCTADRTAFKYRVYLEANLMNDQTLLEVQNRLHQSLCLQNCEYESKTLSGRLPPIEVILTQNGTGEHFKNFHLTLGQRESQFKFLHLQYSDQVAFPIERYKREVMA